MRPTGIDWRAYEPIVLGGRTLAPAPLLDIVLTSGQRRLTHFGIIDSGSDLSCLPPSLSEALGLDLQGAPREVRVLGGVAMVRQVFCDLQVATDFGPLVFRGVEFAVPVGADRTGLVILGQKPLFNEVEIRFQGWCRRFGLQKRLSNLGFVPALPGASSKRPSPR